MYLWFYLLLLRRIYGKKFILLPTNNLNEIRKDSLELLSGNSLMKMADPFVERLTEDEIKDDSDSGYYADSSDNESSNNDMSLTEQSSDIISAYGSDLTEESRIMNESEPEKAISKLDKGDDSTVQSEKKIKENDEKNTESKEKDNSLTVLFKKNEIDDKSKYNSNEFFNKNKDNKKDVNNSMTSKEGNNSMTSKDVNNSMTSKDVNNSMTSKDVNNNMSSKEGNNIKKNKERINSMKNKKKNNREEENIEEENKKGDSKKGDNTKEDNREYKEEDNTKGDNKKGNNKKGNNKKGNNTKEDNREYKEEDNIKRDSLKGNNAKGNNKKEDNREYKEEDNIKGDNTKGNNAKGNNTKGNNTKEDNREYKEEYKEEDNTKEDNIKSNRSKPIEKKNSLKNASKSLILSDKFGKSKSTNKDNYKKELINEKNDTEDALINNKNKEETNVLDAKSADNKKNSKKKGKKKKDGEENGMSPYWTEIALNNKKKSVLINVKRLTIIESITPIKSKTKNDFNKSKSSSESSKDIGKVPTVSISSDNKEETKMSSRKPDIINKIFGIVNKSSTESQNSGNKSSTESQNSGNKSSTEIQNSGNKSSIEIQNSGNKSSTENNEASSRIKVKQSNSHQIRKSTITKTVYKYKLADDKTKTKYLDNEKNNQFNKSIISSLKKSSKKKNSSETKTILAEKSKTVTSSTQVHVSPSISALKKPKAKTIMIYQMNDNNKTHKHSSTNKVQKDSKDIKKSSSNNFFAKKKYSSVNENSSSYKNQSSTSETSSDINQAKNSRISDIFGVLRNIPTSSGKSTKNVFVEGTFSFPKEKSLNKKVFKLSGYIAGKQINKKN